MSHFNKDEQHIQKLKDLLCSKGYDVRNSSIESSKPNKITNPEVIKRLLRMRIRWAGTVIVLIGPRTHTRPWVDWEIEQAMRAGKRIIGVYLNGASESDVPENLNKYGDALVGWTSDRIIGALEGDINNLWETPDMHPRPQQFTLARPNC